MALIEQIVGIALYLASGGFIGTGLFLLGKGQPKELGSMVISLGFLQTICVCFLLALGAGFQALMVIIFAFIWYTFGAALLLGTNLLILGHQLVMAGIMYAGITAYLASYPPAYFTVMTASYTLIIFTLAAGIYAGARAPWLAKINGWILIIEGFLTVLYPAYALAVGMPLP